MNKALLGAMLMIAATSAASAQGYYYTTPYGHGLYGMGIFPGPYAYVRESDAAPPIAYNYGPHGTARNSQHHRRRH